MNKKVILLFFLLLMIPLAVHAEDLTYDEATGAVKQTIQAWYMRGSYRQYNSSKNTYKILRHPEDSTAQDTGYSVCSGFSNDVLMESFGFQSGSNTFDWTKTPEGSEGYCKEARAYIDKYKCKTSNPDKTGCSGEFLIYYSNPADNINYYYNPKNWTSSNPKITSFVKLLQPGDIVSYNGHVVVVYDFKYDSDGKKVDALLFESTTGKLKVKSKIDPDNVKLHQLYYHKVKESSGNGILDISIDGSYMPYEGTVSWRWFSEYKKFVKDGTLSCQTDMCSITRPFYKGTDGKAILNYDVTWPQQIKTSKARLELPGIFISKTSSKQDNNSVILGDSITYTIRIHNNGNMVKVDGKSLNPKYGSFYVEETLPAEVDFVSATVDDSLEGTYDENKRTISWKVSSLNAGQSIVLKYKVKVRKDTNNIGHFFEATGKVYKSSSSQFIPTSTVRLEIIRTTSKSDQEYVDCYNSSKKDGYTALTLIQKTYECVYGKNLGFNLTSFSTSKENMLDKLLVRQYTNPGKGQSGAIRLDPSGDNKIYADMILNNYWSGLVLTNYGTSDGSNYYIFPRWRMQSNSKYIGEINRANTIVSSHFKTGDVLIYYVDKANTKTALRYTNENGIYAYIFIDDKFVGINHSGTTARNEFTDDYYTDKANNLYDGSKTFYSYANYQTLFGKDSYVILRPEKVITEVTSIKVKTLPTKTTYSQKQTLDVSGGVITATNNDGTTEDIGMNDSSVSITGYNANQVGEQTITVTYQGKSTSFKVSVEETVLTSIQVKTLPTKTKYFVGESLDLKGGIILANYSDGSTKTYSMSNSDIKVTGFDSTQPGTKTLTIKYSEKTATFDVQVELVSLSTISIEQYPDKMSYLLEEELNLSGGILKKVYNDSSEQLISMTDSSVVVSGYNRNQAGSQTITVVVEGKSVTFDVVVNNPPSSEEVRVLDSISIYSNPTKKSYKIGESLDLSGGKIKVKYIRTVGERTDEVFEIVDMRQNGVSVSGFSSTEEGEKLITVTYSEKTASFTVVVSKVEQKIYYIEVSKLPKKTKYIQFRERFDVTGGELTISYTNNTTKTISLNDDEITILDFDNTKLGEQQIHVIYKGFETAFPVTIIEDASEIDEEDDEYGEINNIEVIQEPAKIEYMQGEDFDVEGMVLKIQYADGITRIVDLLDFPGQYFVSGFDNSIVGEQTVIINYQGYKVPIVVNVKADDSLIPIPDTFSAKSVLISLFAMVLIGFGSLILIKNFQNTE